MVARPSAITAAGEARKRCNKEKNQCRRIIEAECNGDQGCLENFLPCCATCKVGVGVICALDVF
jgi:hypothetical protein